MPRRKSRRGADIVIDCNKKMGNNRIKGLRVASFPGLDIDEINIPEKLSGFISAAAELFQRPRAGHTTLNYI